MAHFHTQQILGSINTHVELCLLKSGYLAAKTLYDAHQLVVNFVCLLFDAELQVVKPTKNNELKDIKMHEREPQSQVIIGLLESTSGRWTGTLSWVDIVKRSQFGWV